MIRVNLLRNPTPRPEVIFARLVRFIARVPAEKPAARLDRRIFRWVLCGEHGFGRNWRERCPECGGYAEPRLNPEMRTRLDRQRRKTKAILKAKRNPQPTTSNP
jgi:hypothetical protein